METTTEKNIATFTHLSALTQYFIPLEFYFSNSTLTSKKDKSEFVDYSGKQQIPPIKSLLYTIDSCPYRHPILIFTILIITSLSTFTMTVL
jgi:uncharacterized Tic20 family protein